MSNADSNAQVDEQAVRAKWTDAFCMSWGTQTNKTKYYITRIGLMNVELSDTFLSRQEAWADAAARIRSEAQPSPAPSAPAVVPRESNCPEIEGGHVFEGPIGGPDVCAACKAIADPVTVYAPSAPGGADDSRKDTRHVRANLIAICEALKSDASLGTGPAFIAQLEQDIERLAWSEATPPPSTPDAFEHYWEERGHYGASPKEVARSAWFAAQNYMEAK